LSSSLIIRNRQRAISVNTRLLRDITKALLDEFLKPADFDLAIYIVRAPEMARLNETFLQHHGSTDVITFDYSNATRKTRNTKPFLHGEIFVCIDDAIKHARQFRTSCPSELTRYLIHGLLHLQGFDDTHPSARQKMKRRENQLLKEASRLFALSKLASGSRLAA
jgi:probable rRNA maturation factor